MRRLFFLLPDTQSCELVVNELKQAGIPEKHLHVIASLEIPLGNLPEAGVLQKTELAHGLEWGVGLGGSAGLIGSLLAVTFPPAGLVLGGGALLVGTAAGASLGAAISALLASHEHSHQLDAFEQAIEEGQILLMVDVPVKQLEQMRDLILLHHPEAQIGIAKPNP